LDTIHYGGFSLLSKAQSMNLTKCPGKETGLIVGGTKAKPKEFVHMAAIGWNGLEEGTYAFACAGSLISNRYVLTAAHCRTNKAKQLPVIVRLGALNYNLRYEHAPYEDYSVESFINHEQYDKKARRNDIAVIKLDKDVTFNAYIRPACLQQNEEFSGPVTAVSKRHHVMP